MGSVFVSLGLSLALTLLIETAAALLLGLRRRDVLLVVLMNAITNPAVVYLYLLLSAATALPRWALLLPLELAAVAGEWLLLKRFASGVRRPLLTALLLNACSFGVGELLPYLT